MNVLKFSRLGKLFQVIGKSPQDGFFKNPFEKNRPVPDPVPRDGTGHGIVATLPANRTTKKGSKSKLGHYLSNLHLKRKINRLPNLHRWPTRKRMKLKI